ncbi:MAG: hypothetical protein ACE5GX_11280 [Thermoanaerobaculia bacterium]
MRLLCRNRVADFDAWWSVFSSHTQAQRDAGLYLEHVWRSDEDPNDIWFVFEIENVERARAFMNAPEAEDAARDTKVLDGEYHFVGDVRARTQ